jgi:predicted neuraminidase
MKLSAVLLPCFAASVLGVDWTVVDGWNAVPSGKQTTESTIEDCENLAAKGGALQFSFKPKNGHCFTSTSKTFAGKAQSDITSGCIATEVEKCTPTVPTPAPAPPTPFDGVQRPCPTDPQRKDAYMIQPACPAGVTDCKESSNHCNFLELLPDGNIGLAWFSGYREGWDLTQVVMAKSKANASVWSKAVSISSQKGLSAQNPILHAGGDGVLYAFHTRQPKGNSAESAESVQFGGEDPVPSQEHVGKLWMSTSADWGETFTEAVIFEGANGTWGRNRIVPTLDGDWLFPLYNESLKMLGHYTEHSFILRKPKGAPVLPVAGWTESGFKNSSYLVQPSIIRLVPGQPALRAYFRDRRAMWIYTSTSADDGTTWTQPVATALPNNNVGISAWTLASGAVALAFNDMQGQTHHNLRNVLAVAISDDGGATFTAKRLLEHNEREGSSSIGSSAGGVGPTSCNCYSYPTLVQTADSMIHIGYTYQRRTIKVTTVTEAWIRNSTGVLCDSGI